MIYAPGSVHAESDPWRSIIMTIASLETNFVHYLIVWENMPSKTVCCIAIIRRDIRFDHVIQ
jgi:hypothetical protein